MSFLYRLLFVFLLFVSHFYAYAQYGGVSIGKDGLAPHPMAILDIYSDSKGVLFPKVAEYAVLSNIDLNDLSDADGLIIYVLDEQAYYYYNADENRWVVLMSESNIIQSDSIYSNIISTDTLYLGDNMVTGISTDETFSNASDDSLSTQLAIKSFVESSISDVDIAAVLKQGEDADDRSINNLNTLHTKNLIVANNANSNAPNFYVASDRRVKEDIQALQGGIETIMKLHPVKFKYKDFWAKEHGFKNRYYYSFIAQEFKEVFPDDVVESGLYLENDTESVMRINVGSANVLTIKAVQELVVRCEALENENKNLKAKAEELESTKEEIDNLKAELESIKSLLLDRVEK